MGSVGKKLDFDRNFFQVLSLDLDSHAALVSAGSKASRSGTGWASAASSTPA